MAKWLNMPVIAEGVETKNQADFLKSIGCEIIQGYYYAKPMPAEDFEEFLRKGVVGTAERPGSFSEILNMNNFWNPEAQETLIFNSFVGAAGIFEYSNGHLEMLRVNDRFFEAIGSSRESYNYGWNRILDLLSDSDKVTFIKALKSAISTGEDTECTLKWNRLSRVGEPLWLRTRARLIATSGERHLFYATLENITGNVRRDRLVHWTDERYRMMMIAMDSISFDYDVDSDTVNYVFTDSKGSLHERSIFGYLAGELRGSENIHPDCRVRLADAITALTKNGGTDRFDMTLISDRHEPIPAVLSMAAVVDSQDTVYHIVGRFDRKGTANPLGTDKA